MIVDRYLPVTVHDERVLAVDLSERALDLELGGVEDLDAGVLLTVERGHGGRGRSGLAAQLEREVRLRDAATAPAATAVKAMASVQMLLNVTNDLPCLGGGVATTPPSSRSTQRRARCSTGPEKFMGRSEARRGAEQAGQFWPKRPLVPYRGAPERRAGGPIIFGYGRASTRIPSRA